MSVLQQLQEQQWPATILALPLLGVCLGFFFFQRIAEMEEEHYQQQQQQQQHQNQTKNEMPKSSSPSNAANENLFPFVPEGFAMKQQASALVEDHAKKYNVRGNRHHHRQRRSYGEFVSMLLSRKGFASVFLVGLFTMLLLGVWENSRKEQTELKEWSEMSFQPRKDEEEERLTSAMDFNEFCAKGNEFLLKGNRVIDALGQYKAALQKRPEILQPDENDDCDLAVSTSSSFRDSEMAIMHYTRAFYAAEQHGTKYHDVMVWLGEKLGFLWLELDEFETAMKWFESVIYQTTESRIKATILSGYATSIARLGPKAVSNANNRAYDLYSQSLKIYEKLGDRVGVGRQLTNAGSVLLRLASTVQVHDDRGFVEQGYMLVNEGLTLQRKIHDYRGQARSHSILAERYSHLNRTEEAIEQYKNASYIHRGLNDSDAWAETITSICGLLVQLGDNAEAMKCYSAAVNRDRKTSNLDGFAVRLRHVGDGYVNMGKEYYNNAILVYKTSIEAFQSIWSTLKVDSVRLSLEEKTRECYRGLEALYFHLGRTREALEISEQSRGRSLEMLLAQNSRNVNKRLIPNNVSFADMKQLASRQEATIVVYSRISETKLLVWVISSDQDEASFEPFATEIIREAKPRGFIRYLRNQYETTADLRKFYNQLIVPIESAISGSKSLIIVPDGDLFRVPFAALTNDLGRFLIEDFVVRISTSVGAMIQFEQQANNEQKCRRREGSAVVVGDPRRNLPAAASEANYAAMTMNDNQIGTLLLLHEEATRDKLLKAMEASDYIHLAAHGGHDFVEMAENSPPITSFDVEANSLEEAKLVMLSACNTWNGKIRSDGVHGLARAFAAAGAPAVIASLWPVDDNDVLMRQFYDKFFTGECIPAADALRDAILSLIASGTKISVWSPFVLLYDAKPGNA